MQWNNKFIYPKSTRSIVQGSRHYSVNEENLPSVTTILKATESQEKKAKLMIRFFRNFRCSFLERRQFFFLLCLQIPCKTSIFCYIISSFFPAAGKLVNFRNMTPSSWIFEKLNVPLSTVCMSLTKSISSNELCFGGPLSVFISRIVVLPVL